MWGSRSTWACELKSKQVQRERAEESVTLHVSVWVEICKSYAKSRITWVTLHVSVWVEMLCAFIQFLTISRHAPRERVSWNINWGYLLNFLPSHAPRERVSWNSIKLHFRSKQSCHAPRERVSWNHMNIGVFFYFCSHAPRERVSWNFFNSRFSVFVWSHAPRERVSWNFKCELCGKIYEVTLHVSVWVEIFLIRDFPSLSEVTLHVSVWVEIALNYISGQNNHVTLHVSVWVEMPALLNFSTLHCHAPRERVSWNLNFLPIFRVVCSHAPRERVSWNEDICTQVQPIKSRSTWACELKCPCQQSPWPVQRSRSTWACELKF